ncbi:MAG: metallophosphoesterase [Promethearchaeota archaeon]
MTRLVLSRPLWQYYVALVGLVGTAVVLLDSIVLFCLWLAGVPAVPWTTIGWADAALAGTSLPLLSAYAWRRFVNVRPCAAFAWEWDTGPWIHPGSDPRTSVVVNWLTREAAGTRVALGRNEDALTEIIDPAEGAPGTLHRVALDGLEPGAVYYYKVLDFPHDPRVHSFRTAPSGGDNGGKPVKFVVVGDTQNGGGFGSEDWAYPRIVDGWSESGDFDLVLHVGDATDQGNDLKSWHAFLDTSARVASGRPLLVAVGNHDTGTHYLQDKDAKKYPDDGANFDYLLGYEYPVPDDPADARLARDQVTAFRARYHSLLYGNCLFLFVDTQNRKMAAPWNPQWKFIDRELQRATELGLWKVVLVHWPMMEVRLDEDGEYSFKFREFAPYLCPLFDKHGVDLVVSGHEHDYTRVEWEYDPGAPFFDETHAWEHRAITYLVSGGGGNEFRRNPPEVPQDPELTPAGRFLYRENSSHYLHVTASAEKLVVEPRYPDNNPLPGQAFEVPRPRRGL